MFVCQIQGNMFFKKLSMSDLYLKTLSFNLNSLFFWSEGAFVFSDQSDGTVTPDNNVCAEVREGRCPTGPPTH